ncbi:MAG TPA: hypothetical protein VLI90_01380 [Tepidisphaeraceae bacterium]|nr:hypothetical protein [Tepidisphaeraceae bacterium]
MPRKRKHKSSHDFDSERPWTEAQWEAFMKESDSRAARYGELLETFHEEPDGHEKVMREMGWLNEEDDEDEDPELAAEREQWIKEMNEAGEEALRELEAERAADEAAGITPDERRQIEEDEEKRAFPAYGAALDLGHRVIELFKPEFNRNPRKDPDAPRSRAEEDEDELFHEAFMGIQMAGAKLTKAMAFEDDDDTRCANIVCCRWGMEAAEAGKAAWQRLRDYEKSPFTPAVVDDIVAAHAQVIEMIAAHIAEMRSRVWW